VQLFYEPQIESGIRSFTFSKAESKHILKVLRKKSGDQIFLTNGKGFLFECEIMTQFGSLCEVTVKQESYTTPNSKEVHMAVCPTKQTDRFEWFLEKATELGITSITPIRAARSERKDIKTERLEKIVQSAMKQSLHSYLPILEPAIRFTDFIKIPQKGSTYIAHCADGEKSYFKNQLKAGESITILIGPEGDFSPQEIESALKHDYIPVSLGAARLRTETAGIVACHTIQLCNE